MWKKSIFNNITTNGNFAYIHFPLIYKTNNLLYTELYTKSVPAFLELIEIKENIYNEVIDSLVIELLTNEIGFIHNQAYLKFQDIDFLKKIIKKSKDIYKKLPLYINEIENDIVNNKKIKFITFNKLINMFVYLLAVNNISFVAETLLPEHLKKSQNKEAELSYLTKDVFSHMKYYSLSHEKLKNEFTKKELLLFFKNTAFLENELGDATSFENSDYINELLSERKTEVVGSKLTFAEMINTDFTAPEINIVINDDDFNKYPLTVIWSKFLQINLEFRHYWLLRFIRNLRIYFNYNYDIINNRVINDYAKENFEI